MKSNIFANLQILKFNTLFEKKLFTTLSTNAIFFDNNIKYEGIENSFNSYLVSFALKSGYNFDYKIFNNSSLILQPSLKLFYSYNKFLQPFCIIPPPWSGALLHHNLHKPLDQ